MVERQHMADEGDSVNSGAAAQTGKDPEFVLQYKMDSSKRYVDAISQKSEFDRVLDELASVSKDMLDWDVEKFTKKHPGETEDGYARKLEAFLGGFITNAAMELYNRGYPDAAFRRLEQAKSVLDAKRKLESEVEAIKAKQEDTLFDVTDMLGLFGSDGDAE